MNQSNSLHKFILILVDILTITIQYYNFYIIIIPFFSVFVNLFRVYCPDEIRYYGLDYLTLTLVFTYRHFKYVNRNVLSPLKHPNMKRCAQNIIWKERAWWLEESLNTPMIYYMECTCSFKKVYDHMFSLMSLLYSFPSKGFHQVVAMSVYPSLIISHKKYDKWKIWCWSFFVLCLYH